MLDHLNPWKWHWWTQTTTRVAAWWTPAKIENPQQIKPRLPSVFGRSNSGDSSDVLLLPSLPRSHERHQKRAFLELELKGTQRAAFRNGTCSNYLNYLAQYELFCDEYRYMPFPMKEIVLSMFAQFLSRKMKPQSIKAVLGGLHTVSTTAGFDIPQKQFPLVNLTLWGLGNLKQTPPDQAHPMMV